MTENSGQNLPKMLACYLHTLPGTPFVFQGEELGMTNVAFPSIDDYNDIDTRNYYKTMIEQGASPEEALAESRSISRDNARNAYAVERQSKRRIF